MLLSARFILSGVISVASAVLLVTSVHQLHTNPAGMTLLAAFNSATSHFNLMADGECIGTFTVQPQSEALIIRSSIESAEAGRLAANIALVFNELSQLAQGLGRLRVDERTLLEFELRGVMPIDIQIKAATMPIPRFPPVPILVTREQTADQVLLYARGISLRRSQEIRRISTVAERFKVVPTSNSAAECAYRPFRFSGLFQ